MSYEVSFIICPTSCSHHSQPNLLFFHFFNYWPIPNQKKFERTNALTNSFKISIWIEEGRERKTWLLFPPGKKRQLFHELQFLFCLFCLPGYLKPACGTCCILATGLFWVIGRWQGVREKSEGYGDKKDRQEALWKSVRRVEFTAGEDGETEHKTTVKQPI